MSSNQSQRSEMEAKTSWYHVCGKCLLMAISIGLFGWGAFAYSPTQGHEAGAPTVIQRLIVKRTTIEEQLAAERKGPIPSTEKK